MSSLQMNKKDPVFVKDTNLSGISFVVEIMKHQEKEYLCDDYLSDGSNVNLPLAANEECREKMCAWFYNVIDHYNFNRETAEISVSYLDRFLLTPIGNQYLRDRNDFQLAAITSLYIGVKLFESIILDLKTMSMLSGERCTESQIAVMEFEILKALKWKMNPPTSKAFLQHMLMILPDNIDSFTRNTLFEVSCFQIEQSVCDYYFLKHKPSTIAIASILNAIEMGFFSTPSCRHFLRNLVEATGTSIYSSEVKQIRCRLSKTLVNSLDNKAYSMESFLQSTVRKLLRKKGNISLLSVARSA